MGIKDSVQLRLAAFEYLNKQARMSPYVSREQLESFEYQGVRLPLISRYRGIHKPGDWRTVLSVLSTDRSPDQGGYDDVERDDGTLLYRFMNNPGQDLNAYNRALLTTGELGLPLILLEKKASKLFEAFYPVWIRGSSREGVIISYQTPNSELGEIVDLAAEAGPDIRDYVKATAKRRIHQEVFRSRVLSAYGDRCAICKLGRRGLLDAAHIIDDAHADGHAIVPNGLALCRIHHGAFDQFLIGIRPDRTIEVAHDVLEEVDGPMLQHGLKEIDRQEIRVPRSLRNQPDPERLQWKYERFLARTT
jgi:putative restriction endonuclease